MRVLNLGPFCQLDFLACMLLGICEADKLQLRRVHKRWMSLPHQIVTSLRTLPSHIPDPSHSDSYISPLALLFP